ncbi:helix-turn-helix domain-containing protein [Silanimonas algicola]
MAPSPPRATQAPGTPLERPRLSIGRSRVAYIGPGLDLAPHRNATATVAIAVDAPFRLGIGRARIGPDAPLHRLAVIPPGTWHHLVAAGPMVFLYLDAQAADARSLAVLDLDALPDGAVGALGALALHGTVDDVCAALGLPTPPPLEPRLADALARMDEDPEAFASVDALSSAFGLSRSRTQALFTAAVGMPFRRYRLWRRMARVMARLQAGATLTQAAIDAGFASPSHLATAFRTQFGLAPSALLGRGLRIDWGDGAQPG